MLIDKLNIAHAELIQKQKVSKIRALIQVIRTDVIRIDAELQVIADSGIFDTIAIEIKDALVKAKNIINDTKIAFEDTDVTKLLDWSP